MASVREDLMTELHHSLWRIDRSGEVLLGASTWRSERERKCRQISKRGFGKRNISSIPPGKGEEKAVVKKNGIEIWQKWWEEDKKGRGYYKTQKSVSVKNYRERNRREEILMRRLRVDHTGLNRCLFLMEKGIMVIVITVGLKKMLSMLYLSVLYTRWKDGCSGFRARVDSEKKKGEGVTRKALFNDTGLMNRIWAHLKWHDVTHSCTVGGGMHLKVVCNPQLTKRRRELREVVL